MTSDDGRRLLIFRASPRSQGLVALPTDHVIETMRPLPLEPLGDGGGASAAGVIGASVVRGEPTPVIDLAVLFGEMSVAESKREKKDSSRWITVRTARSRVVALLVHEVIGIRRVDEIGGHAHFQSMPPLLSTTTHGAIDKLAVLDGELLVLLEAGKLVVDAAKVGGGEPAATPAIKKANGGAPS